MNQSLKFSSSSAGFRANQCRYRQLFLKAESLQRATHREPKHGLAVVRPHGLGRACACDEHIEERPPVRSVGLGTEPAHEGEDRRARRSEAVSDLDHLARRDAMGKRNLSVSQSATANPFSGLTLVLTAYILPRQQSDGTGQERIQLQSLSRLYSSLRARVREAEITAFGSV